MKYKKTKGLYPSLALMYAVYSAIAALGVLAACSKSNRIQCQDPNALNFNQNERCLYTTTQRPAVRICAIPSTVRETSGLARVDSRLLTHNDKGGEAAVYWLDTVSCAVLHTFRLNQVSAIDWEDIWFESPYLYVGDIGNNDGDRKNLGIYKIHEQSLAQPYQTQISHESFIGFSYPEQTSFASGNKHNFDAEALIHFEGALYVFTKNRKDSFTQQYKIPDEPGMHAATLVDAFDIGVMVTGAALSPDKQTLALLGYNKDQLCELWLFTDFEGDRFFKGNKQRIVLGAFEALSQMEGVVFSDAKTLWISAEKEDLPSAYLYKLQLD
jgi:hypothetical protein